MQITENVMEGICLLFLWLCAIFDIRSKEIPAALLGAGLFTTLAVNVWNAAGGKGSLLETGFCLLPGIFLLLVGFLTREKVGYGDGLMLLVVGLCSGFYGCLFALCVSLVLSSVISLLLLGLHKVRRDSRIAFAPFLALGMGVMMFV